MRKLYLILLLIALNSTVLFAQIYVTEAGAGNKDGTSWVNAYDNTQLQQAINEAESATIKQVWVAKGTYKPTESLSSTGFLTDGTTPVTNRDKAFILKTAVEIYGGFAGTESAIGDRTGISTTNETILSGDLNDNNTADDGDYYHVVSSRDYSKGAILDGFTIQHGFANGTGGITENGIEIVQNNGGGLAIRGTYTEAIFRNLIIKNCASTNYGGGMWARGSGTADGYVFENLTFQNNTSLRGAGIYMDVSGGTHKAQFSNCKFLNNSGTGATSGDGGGAMFCANGTATRTVSVLNSLFKGNTTKAYGGAIRINDATTVNLTNVNFEDGISDLRGGAIYSTSTSIVNISDCNFYNNKSGAVGGHYYIFGGTVNVNNSTFEQGNSTTTGGAIYMNDGTFTATASTFKSNTSTTAGGVVYVAGGAFIATNSFFKNNTSTTNGGAIYNASGTLTITSSEFTSNTNNGTTGGGAIYTSNGPVNISKSKFYSNTSVSGAGAIYFTGVFNYSINNSIFYNNSSKGGTGNTVAAIYLSTVNSTLTVINSTFYANKSTATVGAAISFNNTANCNLNLYNNIFDGNLGGYDFDNQTGGSSSDIRRGTSATQLIKNNLLQSTLADGTSGNRTVANTYTLGSNLLFVSTNPSDDNFLWPRSDSFAIDKGDNALYDTNVENITNPAPPPAAIPSDLLGNPRLVNGGIADKIDLGAIEWSTVLPVKVSSFTASLTNNRTQLKWSVGTEDNVNRYEIERSQNGADFTKVAEISANGSASYQTADNSPQAGDNYYRLVTIDNDGSRSQYDVVRIVKVASLTAQRERLQVYPNPVKGNEVKVSLDSPAGTYGYKVVNTSGSVVQQGSINYNGSFATINFSPSVTGGIYVLHFSNGTQAKLVKE